MLLSINGLAKQFANDIVLEEVTFRVDRREKIALVGRNGAGKSTLLKILIGDLDADAGSVQWARGAKVGYLSQSSTIDADKSVLEVVTEARKHLVEVKSRLVELEQKLEDNPSAEDLEEFAFLSDHFASEGGYAVETDIKVVLNKLGFDEAEFGKQVGSLSGGERTRLTLAKLLLEEPELLILDEPTNHLDLEAIEWLENWLKNYPGAALLVSHDRTFLQNVAERIVELRHGVVRSFDGPFDRYLQLAKEEDERLANLAAKQTEEMAKLDEYVRRFMNSQRTAQARGRLKKLEKLQENRIEAPKNEKDIKGGFAITRRAGDIVLECKQLSMGFANQRLFQNLDWTVRWKERWGMIGSNGAGKSTLMKIALGSLEPLSGSVRLGSSVELGWFTQDAETLDLEDTPLEAVCGATGLEFGPARSLLGRFLLGGDDVFRPIKTLSGGERVKVALAILTAQKPNVLVLDEPTNHLDISSREALATVLNEFNGTLILISHDRWLLGQVTDHTINLRHGEVVQFGGSYNEYRASKQTSVLQTKATQTKGVTAPTISPRELSKEIARLKKEIENVEERINLQEEEKAALEQRMSSGDTDQMVSASREFPRVQGELDKLMNQWTESSEQLEQLLQLQVKA